MSQIIQGLPDAENCPECYGETLDKWGQDCMRCDGQGYVLVESKKPMLLADRAPTAVA